LTNGIGVSLPTNGDGRLAHELPGAGEREYIDLDDEEGILRAAAQIRQRRVAERLREIQERRQQSRPVRIKKHGGPVLHGDCLDLIPTLEDGSVSLVVTSPPYAEQRAGHYGGTDLAEARCPAAGKSEETTTHVGERALVQQKPAAIL
jgi:hypothetical protein